MSILTLTALHIFLCAKANKIYVILQVINVLKAIFINRVISSAFAHVG